MTLLRHFYKSSVDQPYSLPEKCRTVRRCSEDLASVGKYKSHLERIYNQTLQKEVLEYLRDFVMPFVI